jgi:uncharacterized membrane protein YfcA
MGFILFSRGWAYCEEVSVRKRRKRTWREATLRGTENAVTHPAFLALIGLLVGIYSGIMGLGGGTIMIPIMILLWGFTQKEALGTSLAVMLPPVTLPAVLEYYRNGNVNLRVAVWMAVGMIVGTFAGAYIANKLPQDLLKLIFGFVLIYIGAYTVLGRDNLTRTLLLSTALVLIGVGIYWGARWMDARA